MIDPNYMKVCVDCEVEKPGKANFKRKMFAIDGLEDVCNDCRRLLRTAPVVMRIFKSAKARAAKKKLPFTIQVSDIVIPEFCPVLGIELAKKHARLFNDIRPSLDRFKPELGYVPGNIAVISWKANRLKNNGSTEEFEKLAAWMRGHDAAPNPDPEIEPIPRFTVETEEI